MASAAAGGPCAVLGEALRSSKRRRLLIVNGSSHWSPPRTVLVALWLSARTWRGQIADDRDVFWFFDIKVGHQRCTPILSAARLVDEAWLEFASAGSRQEAIRQKHLLGLYRARSGAGQR